MKIILATPIYPPELGGPSQYVKNLSEGLGKKGMETEVVSYNDIRNMPQPFRFITYCLNLLKSARKAEIVYAFNLMSCGLPAFCVSRIFQKRFVIRLGGDFLWERKVESENTEQTLKEYYQQPKVFKEKVFILLINKILKGADVIIFSSNFQKEIYMKHFQISAGKIAVIPNPFPDIEAPAHSVSNRQFLYAGRLLKLKNLDRLIAVFKKTPDEASLKIIGSGPEERSLKQKIHDLGLENRITVEKPISHKDLLKEIAGSYACILPSFSDISPNFVLECIKSKTPVLLTKETEYYKQFRESLVFFDPKDKKDIGDKIRYVLDDGNYKHCSDKIENINTSYSWDDVAESHLSLFRQNQ